MNLEEESNNMCEGIPFGTYSKLSNQEYALSPHKFKEYISYLKRHNSEEVNNIWDGIIGHIQNIIFNPIPFKPQFSALGIDKLLIFQELLAIIVIEGGLEHYLRSYGVYYKVKEREAANNKIKEGINWDLLIDIYTFSLKYGEHKGLERRTILELSFMRLTICIIAGSMEYMSYSSPENPKYKNIREAAHKLGNAVEKGLEPPMQAFALYWLSKYFLYEDEGRAKYYLSSLQNLEVEGEKELCLPFGDTLPGLLHKCDLLRKQFEGGGSECEAIMDINYGVENPVSADLLERSGSGSLKSDKAINSLLMLDEEGMEEHTHGHRNSHFHIILGVQNDNYGLEQSDQLKKARLIVDLNQGIAEDLNFAHNVFQAQIKQKTGGSSQNADYYYYLLLISLRGSKEKAVKREVLETIGSTIMECKLPKLDMWIRLISKLISFEQSQADVLNFLSDLFTFMGEGPHSAKKSAEVKLELAKFGRNLLILSANKEDKVHICIEIYNFIRNCILDYSKDKPWDLLEIFFNESSNIQLILLFKCILLDSLEYIPRALKIERKMSPFVNEIYNIVSNIYISHLPDRMKEFIPLKKGLNTRKSPLKLFPSYHSSIQMNIYYSSNLQVDPVQYKAFKEKVLKYLRILIKQEKKLLLTTEARNNQNSTESNQYLEFGSIEFEKENYKKALKYFLQGINEAISLENNLQLYTGKIKNLYKIMNYETILWRMIICLYNSDNIFEAGLSCQLLTHCAYKICFRIMKEGLDGANPQLFEYVFKMPIAELLIHLFHKHLKRTNQLLMIRILENEEIFKPLKKPTKKQLTANAKIRLLEKLISIHLY